MTSTEIVQSAITSRIEVRRARESDVGEIFRILNYEILNTTSCFDVLPKTVEDHQKFYNQYEKRTYPIFVAEQISSIPFETVKIVGWSKLSPYSSKAAYSITSEISIYVDREHTGRGVGHILLQKLIEHAKAVGIRVLIALITDENEGSVRFHERAGFETSGILKKAGIKFDRVLDVRIMQLHL